MKSIISAILLSIPIISHASVLTVGDSITAGLFRNSQTVICFATGRVTKPQNQGDCNSNGLINRGGYQPELSSLLSVDVVNHSQSGASSERILSIFQSVQNRDSFKYLVIMAGTNDAIGGVPSSETISNIRSIVNQFDGVSFVLTIPPIYTRGSTVTRNIEELNQKIRSSFRNVIDTNAALDQDWPSNNSGDGVHLSVAGNSVVANEVFNGMRKRVSVIMTPIIMLLLEE